MGNVQVQSTDEWDGHFDGRDIDVVGRGKKMKRKLRPNGGSGEYHM